MSNKVLGIVSQYCHEKLLKDNEALDYLLNERRLSRESLDKWEIGLFPQDLRELFDIIDPKELRSSNVVKNASRSMFQNHDIVMPIKDVYGNYVAIAGRTRLTDEEREKIKVPKYINSTYSKTHHLFGMNFAKHSILKTDVVYVVEGYFDVIMPHQKGFENIVATCGAYLSTRHLILLSRYTNNVVLFLDNEENAQDKAQKIVEKKQHDGLNLSRLCPLPDGIKDIDQFLRNNSIMDFKSLLQPQKAYEFRNILD
jgi:DNA primase